MSKEEEMMKNLDELLERKIGRTKEYPALDVVPVVRCGQCCNADIRWEGLYCFCTLHEEYRTLDYFCASGGKKDEEDIEIANINL